MCNINSKFYCYNENIQKMGKNIKKEEIKIFIEKHIEQQSDNCDGCFSLRSAKFNVFRFQFFNVQWDKNKQFKAKMIKRK